MDNFQLTILIGISLCLVTHIYYQIRKEINFKEIKRLRYALGKNGESK